MQGVSIDFQTMVKQSHTAVSRVDVIQNGKVVAELEVFDGEVTADRTASAMRQCSVMFGDPDGTLTPQNASSLMVPFGTRIQIFKGVQIPGTVTTTEHDFNAATWGAGTNNGTVTGADGALILGYGS